MAILCLLTIAITTQGFAQGAPGSNSSQLPQANPLPLSGRASQSGSVIPVESPIAGTTNSVNTINPTVQVQGAYAASAMSTAKMPFSGKLSLREAVQRGLSYNLGAVGLNHAARQAQGQSQAARSALLPNLSGYLTEVVQQTDLAAEGFNFKLPGFALPSIVGPFNYFDLRGSLSQSVVDLTAWNNYRASHEVFRAAQFAARDARDLVVLAVCGAYLQVISTRERVKSAHASTRNGQRLISAGSR